jgi:hypothetical protein
MHVSQSETYDRINTRGEDMKKTAIVLSTMRTPAKIVEKTVTEILQLVPDAIVVISMNDRAGEKSWETVAKSVADKCENVWVQVTTGIQDYIPESKKICVTHKIAKGDNSALIYLNGFKLGLNLGATQIIEMDLGGSMNHRDIPEFIEKLTSAQAVLSTRDPHFGGKTVNNPTQRLFLSKAGTWMANQFLNLGQTASDMTSGFEAFEASILKELLDQIPPENWLCVRMDAAHLFQTEIRTYILWKRKKIVWQPITFGEDKEGKTIRDYAYLIRNLLGFFLLLGRKSKIQNIS